MEYKVYKDEGGKIQAVKDGFCWLAFVFGWLWALSESLFLIALILFFSTSLLYGVASSFGAALKTEVTIWVTVLLISTFVGVKASSWRDKSLQKRGYVLVGTITAKSENDARNRYYQNTKGE